MKITAACQRCGKPLITTAARQATGRGRFCSRACATSAIHTGRPKPASGANWAKAVEVLRGSTPHNKRPWVALTCQQCGAAYERRPAAAARSRFCSHACSSAHKRTVTGTAHPLYRLVERSCEFCGKVCHVKPAKLAEFRFCSRRCNASHMAATYPRTTSIERALWQELTRRGIPFEAEYPVGQYSVDIALTGPRIAIEADGDYWHGKPQQQAKDQRKTGYLRSKGWRVFRFTETEIKADAAACIQRVLSQQAGLLP